MDLSVLLPVGGAPENARACLASLEHTMPRRWRYEVVPTVGDARAPVLCLLDPGTTLVHGWLEPMWMLLRREPHAGCIGNIHREPYSGLIEHAGIVFDADGLPAPSGRGEAVLPLACDERRPAVSLACALVRRDVFLGLDGFGERFRSGRFRDVDFCLRAAERGFQHHVANRSVVYHRAVDAPPGDDELALYRKRWGERARVYHREKTVRLASDAYSPERWDASRDVRLRRRREAAVLRQDGRRYLTKHLLRPWRYNYGRICRALVQTSTPLPDELPPLPGKGLDRAEDGWLFDPPRR